MLSFFSKQMIILFEHINNVSGPTPQQYIIADKLNYYFGRPAKFYYTH